MPSNPDNLEHWSRDNTQFQIVRDPAESGSLNSYEAEDEGYRPDGLPRYRWLLVARVERPDSGPKEIERDVERSERFYDSIEATEDSIRRFQGEHPEHGGIPVVLRTDSGDTVVTGRGLGPAPTESTRS